MNVNRRTLLLISVMAVALSMLAAPVLGAPPLNDAADGRYVIVTLRAKALTRVGEIVYGAEASINLECLVTERRANWFIFKVVEGVVTVNGTSYAVIADENKGAYNIPRHATLLRSRAQDALGGTARFVLHGVDVGVYHGEDDGENLQGTLMNIRGVFQDPTGRYWRLLISAYRVKVA